MVQLRSPQVFLVKSSFVRRVLFTPVNRGSMTIYLGQKLPTASGRGAQGVSEPTHNSLHPNPLYITISLPPPTCAGDPGQFQGVSLPNKGTPLFELLKYWRKFIHLLLLLLFIFISILLGMPRDSFSFLFCFLKQGI